ncbi:MAG TPA: VWA domain-containing protein [Thermoanaerobaculia bacterium]
MRAVTGVRTGRPRPRARVRPGLALAVLAALLAASPHRVFGQAQVAPADGTQPTQPAQPSIRLLAPASDDLPTGETRIEGAVEGYAPGDQVEFFVDGRKVGTAGGPPWIYTWSAGETVRRHDVTVALVRGGREIARSHVRTRDVGFTSSARAHAVGLSPIVTDEKGRAVHGLTANDFAVYEDGKPQQIETFEATDSPLAAILVLDISESMTPKLEDARRAAHAFVAALKPEDEIGLYTFNSTVVGAVDLTKNHAAIQSAIDEARPAGETALYDVTAAALRRLKPVKNRKAVILFTDGEDNQSRLSVAQVIEMARASEVSIFSIAQGTDESKTLKVFLDRLADQTGGRCWFIGSIKKLNETFRQVVAELKSQYFLTYTPPETLRKSWRQVQVRVNRPSVVVRAKREYYLE